MVAIYRKTNRYMKFIGIHLNTKQKYEITIRDKNIRAIILLQNTNRRVEMTERLFSTEIRYQRVNAVICNICGRSAVRRKN